MDATDALVIDEPTPLGFRVKCSASYWERIASIKHPTMRGRLDDVRVTLREPDEVRCSVHDPDVLLFHRNVAPRWVCAVVKKGDGTG